MQIHFPQDHRARVARQFHRKRVVSRLMTRQRQASACIARESEHHARNSWLHTLCTITSSICSLCSLTSLSYGYFIYHNAAIWLPRNLLRRWLKTPANGHKRGRSRSDHPPRCISRLTKGRPMSAWNQLFTGNTGSEKEAHVIPLRTLRCLAARWLSAFALAAIALPAQARTFSCSGGDTACLIGAIVEANANGKANTIALSAGTYTLTAADTLTPGGYEDTGLPAITGKLTIVGDGAEDTVIERSTASQLFIHPFRIFSVTGDLSLRRVTVRGGGGSSGGVPGIIRGGCILSGGTLAITDSVITNCQAREGAGLNVSQATILNSTIAGNTASVEGGGVLGRTLVITNTSILSNSALFGAGVDCNSTGGKVTIVNSTFARNGGFTGSAVHLGPASDAPRFPPDSFIISATIENSTIADNNSVVGRALHTDQGPTLTIKGSILANNTPAATADCPNAGATSLGYNLIGNPASCPTFLRSNDIQGDPGLGAFVDDGTPGHAYFPPLPGSPAIDGGGVVAKRQSGKFDKPHAAETPHGPEGDCPAGDQIGQPRAGHCDLGSIEFVADRVSIRQVRFDSRSGVLFVSANSSAARDDVSLAVSVEECLASAPTLRLGGGYLLLTQPACGNLEGATVRVTSSGGGSAAALIR
ncbi:MAG: right-handed parallel beta-helix repeat-containing protein [Acidobacteriota bacterium]